MVPQQIQQMQQKMAELEKENKMLKFQVDQQKRTIEEQNETIDKLKVSNVKKRVDMATQTNDQKPSTTNLDIITDRKADLLVEIESLKRRLSKMDKRIAYHKNKENKFLFFLFTL